MINILIYQNHNIYYTSKKMKTSCKTANLKDQLERGINKLKYLINHILYQIFRSFYIIKKRETVTDNPLIRI